MNHRRMISAVVLTLSSIIFWFVRRLSTFYIFDCHESISLQILDRFQCISMGFFARSGNGVCYYPYVVIMLMCIDCGIVNTYISQPAYHVKSIYFQSFKQYFQVRTEKSTVSSLADKILAFYRVSEFGVIGIRRTSPPCFPDVIL